MGSRLRFCKYEGLGNDFIVVPARDEREVPPDIAARLCDRRLGVGADGLLLVLPPRCPEHAARMRVINADGSIPEMCGNGVRCVALHLARAAGVDDRAMCLQIETDAGERACLVKVEGPAGSCGSVTVAMGTVRVVGDRTLDLESGRRVALTAADAGNPHAVLFGAFTRADVELLGPPLAVHEAFGTRGTNVEFAQVAGDAAIDLVVWERGVGVTLACGTGACATVAVACARGSAPWGRPVAVRLPGGTLEVTIEKGGDATMRGLARHVFSGEVAI